MSTATPSLDVYYPESDGKPMAETDLHIHVLLALRQLLINRYANDPNTYASGNNMMYYVQGNPKRWVSPDVYVVHGIPKRFRDKYLVWDEGKGPDFVIEVTSKTTRKEDLNAKMALYRDVLRVSEYLLFDQRREYIKTALRGYRLQGPEYVSIDPVNGRLPSQQIGLHLEPQGAELKLWDPATEQYVLTTEQQLDRERALVERYRQKFGPLPE
jgi:Uma2 family endonuclease